MKTKSHISIKLAIIYIFVALIVAGAQLAYTFYSDYKSTRSELTLNIENILDTASLPAIHALFEVNRVNGITIVEGLKSYPFITESIIYDDLGEEFTRSSANTTQADNWSWLTTLLIKQEQETFQKPLFHKLYDKNIGHISITIDYSIALKSFYDRISSMLVYTFFSALVFFSLIFSIGHYYIAQPMMNLSEVLENADDQQNVILLPPKHHEKSELGVLVAAFNKTIEQLHKARTQAEKANAAKSTFLSSMSHEFRTPLNAIIGFTQLLAQNESNDDKKVKLAHIERSGKTLLSLVNDVLDISSLESGDVIIEMQCVNIADQVSEVITRMTDDANERAIQLINKVEASPILVNADASKLEQILFNFASNAVKYNKPRGTVTFYTEVINNQYVKIHVSDTGPGVADAKLEKIFEPFNRLTMSTSNEAGTGIGLTVSKKLATAMNAEIGVFNNTEGGLDIWVQFAIVELEHS